MRNRTGDARAAAGRQLFWPGVLTGAGLGGFVDGIVLHQLLQWHHLVSEIYPPENVENLKINTLWDGIFHAGTWILTLLGVFLLLGAARPAGGWSWRPVVGGMLAGFGLFNIVEGIINHLVLQIHHVRPGPNALAYDLAFLALGVILAAAGWFYNTRPAGYPSKARTNP